ncbi:MAG TPA: class I SAM-dependent methyltransferase [Candidatus Polarisedimenticolaceae bacterium]|nr:class I SAM-dependent methyltransferase [Candidatus Polarisedimenticolaceae bacterium]
MTEPGPRFDGNVPAFYDRFMGPFFFDPFAKETARRVAATSPSIVLEIACGTGIVTRRLRQALPPASQIVATDLNQPMLDYARARLMGADVHWRTADAQELPFKNGAFDAVVCQFGLMFVPDKEAAFREARRVIRPGGALVLATWCSLDDNPPARIASETLERLFPDDPPRFLDIPHGMHDPVVLDRLARGAGFDTVAVERVDLEASAPSARHVATGLARGTPLAGLLTDRGADFDQVIDAFARGMRDGEGAVPYSAPVAALILTAT